MRLEWEYDSEGWKKTNYRGCVITFKEDKYARNPRKNNYDLSFVSVNKKFATPDDNKFKPVGEFYIDILRFVSNPKRGKRVWKEEEALEAQRYVIDNLIIFPVEHRMFCDPQLAFCEPPTVTRELKRLTENLYGAMFMSIERAREIYGADKSIDDLYDIIRPEAKRQLIEYLLWGTDKVMRIDAKPDPIFYNKLRNAGEETRKIAYAWRSKLAYNSEQMWGISRVDAKEVIEWIQSIDEVADWVADELRKLNREQLKPELKKHTIKLSEKEE